jgi:hypothetical protein
MKFVNVIAVTIVPFCVEIVSLIFNGMVLGCTFEMKIWNQKFRKCK